MPKTDQGNSGKEKKNKESKPSSLPPWKVRPNSGKEKRKERTSLSLEAYFHGITGSKKKRINLAMRMYCQKHLQQTMMNNFELDSTAVRHPTMSTMSTDH